tara:strand:- start:1596 stop:3413 length:1818 start_codon:yes stop_codon:yes gene_type:complete
MAEVTQDMTLGQALDLAQSRATEANEKNAAKNVGQLKNAISKGKLGENVSLESPYFSTVKGKDYLTNIQAGKGKVETDFYVKAQALEKYTNQALVESGLTDLTTNVTGATGLAKDVGAKGQLRGEQAMRGMIPFEEIDKIYAQGFNEMKSDKAISDATKDFLIYHRYTSHRVGTILNDTEDYKSLRLSDISIITGKDGETSVSIKGEVRDKKKRYATTYTGSFAEFLKGVYNKAKSANPDMPNSEVKLFNTSQTKVNQAWKKYLLPKFLDQHEISLPVNRKGKVVTGLTEIIRSANIEALESDLGLASNLGDDFMGHTAQGTKAKSYKVNTPESKAIGSITENMVKTSAFNLGAGTTNNLFSGYGLNAPTLNIANEGVKVYDGHKSEFKFNADALKEVVAPRPPTEFEIKEADATAKRNISLLESETEDIEIGKLKKRQEKAKLQKEVIPLEQEAMVKKIQEDELKRTLKKQLKKEGNLIPNPELTIPEEDVKKLKAQGLWDIITGVADKGTKVIAGAIGVEAARQLFTDPAAFAKDVVVDTALERGLGLGPGAAVGFSLMPTEMGKSTIDDSQMGEYKTIPLEQNVMKPDDIQEGFINQNQSGR